MTAVDCHCEEWSDVAISTFAGATKKSPWPKMRYHDYVTEHQQYVSLYMLTDTLSDKPAVAPFCVYHQHVRELTKRRTSW